MSARRRPPRRRRASRRPAALALLALLAALPQAGAALTLPFLGGAEAPPPPAPPRPVVTEIVAEADAAGRSIPGVIASATEVQMAFQTLGRIVERPVDVGDRVAQGDLLARLDPEDLTGTVRAAEAALQAAKVNLATAQSTAERTRALASRNVASRAQLEQAEQGLAAARSSADQARARLESARDAEGHALMQAPISGVVSAVRAAPGAVVAAGDPILTLAAEDGLEAQIDLTEVQLDGIVPGTAFGVWRESVAAAPVRGTVERIDPVADAQTRTRRVHIRLDDANGFRLGSLIRVRREGEAGKQLTLPAAAVFDPADPPPPPRSVPTPAAGGDGSAARQAPDAKAPDDAAPPATTTPAAAPPVDAPPADAPQDRPNTSAAQAVAPQAASQPALPAQADAQPLAQAPAAAASAPAGSPPAEPATGPAADAPQPAQAGEAPTSSPADAAVNPASGTASAAAAEPAPADASADAAADTPESTARPDAAADQPPGTAQPAASDASHSALPAAQPNPARAPANPHVWVVLRDGDSARVALQPVTLGPLTGDRYAVTGGLAVGAEVVIRGVHSLTEGQPVGRRLDHP